MSSISLPKRPRRPRPQRDDPPNRDQPRRRSGASPIKQPWLIYALLGAGVIALIILGVTALGTPSSSARTETETVEATNGVVQETASGSGNVEAGVDDQVSFATSGTLEDVYVKAGEAVKQGQLLAKLNPATADLTLEQAEATLAQAEDTLTTAEDDESSADSDGVDNTGAIFNTGDDAGSGSTTSTGTTTSDPTTVTTSDPTSPTKVVTVTVTTPSTTAATTGSKSSSSASSSTGSSTDDAATVESDKVQVASDEEQVKDDEEAVKETKLYAPVSGTIAELSSDSIGTEEGSSSSSSSSDTSTTASSTSGATEAGSLGGDSSSDSSSTTDDTDGFAEIVNTKTLSMTVAFSESDINEIKVGQAATVTLSALTGTELAGTITSIDPIGTEDDDVVSYDATITIDQSTDKVKSGMSATADVVIESKSGVTVPSDAVSGDTVQLIKDGKATTQDVTVGLAGTSRDVISSGLKAGDELKVTKTLPSLGASTSTTSSSSSSDGAATGGFGDRGGGGGGFAGGGFGGGATGAS